MHTYIRDGSSGRDDLAAQFKRGRNPDGFDRRVHTTVRCSIHDRRNGLSVAAIDCGGGTEPLCNLQTVVVEIDHDDLAG
jgi:hypothetical protein